jgi:hypothetical protein
MLADKIQKELGALLACLRHTASVHPGPGSNPQMEDGHIYDDTIYLS